jgi:hypothetical protein
MGGEIMSSKPTRCGETNQKYIFTNPTKKNKGGEYTTKGAHPIGQGSQI